MAPVYLYTAAKGSNAYNLNQASYEWTEYWAVNQMTKFHKSKDDLETWMYQNAHLLTEEAWKRLNSVLSPFAFKYREIKARAWKAEGKVFKWTLIVLTSEVGGELLGGLFEGGEGVEALDEGLIGETATEGEVASTETVESTTSNALTKTTNISKHAEEQMAERGITEKMVQKGVQKGERFFDPKNNSINFVLRKGFASGKDLLIGTNPITGKITTVIRGTSLVAKRFIKL